MADGWSIDSFTELRIVHVMISIETISWVRVLCSRGDWIRLFAVASTAGAYFVVLQWALKVRTCARVRLCALESVSMLCGDTSGKPVLNQP